MADNFTDLRGAFRRQYAKKLSVGINYQAPLTRFIEEGANTEKMTWKGDDLFFPIHVAGGVGMGFRAVGGRMPTPGKQTVVQGRVGRSLFYMTAKVDNPTVARSKDMGGYVNVLKFITDAMLKEAKVRFGFQYWGHPVQDNTSNSSLNGVVAAINTAVITSSTTIGGETVYDLPVKGFMGWRKPNYSTFVTRGNDAVCLFNDQPYVVLGTIAQIKAGGGTVRKVKYVSEDGAHMYLDAAYTSTAAAYITTGAGTFTAAGEYVVLGDALAIGDNDYNTAVSGLGMFLLRGADADKYQGQSVTTIPNYAYCPNLKSMNATAAGTDAAAWDDERMTQILSSHFWSRPGLAKPSDCRIISHFTASSALRDAISDRTRFSPLEFKAGYKGFSFTWNGVTLPWDDNDRFCPRGYVFALDKTSWGLAVNEEGHFVDFGGGEIWRQLDEIDGRLVRWQKYWQLACMEPGKNLAVGDIPVNHTIA